MDSGNENERHTSLFPHISVAVYEKQHFLLNLVYSKNAVQLLP